MSKRDTQNGSALSWFFIMLLLAVFGWLIYLAFLPEKLRIKEFDGASVFVGGLGGVIIFFAAIFLFLLVILLPWYVYVAAVESRNAARSLERIEELLSQRMEELHSQRIEAAQEQRMQAGEESEEIQPTIYPVKQAPRPRRLL